MKLQGLLVNYDELAHLTTSLHHALASNDLSTDLNSHYGLNKTYVQSVQSNTFSVDVETI